jgi:hypothetical protein
LDATGVTVNWGYSFSRRRHGHGVLAMQSNQAQTFSFLESHRKEIERDAPISVLQPQPIALDGEMVERAAQALFEFVFACSKRLDGKHLWMNCDEDTKESFRGEATAVIQAAWSFMFSGEVREGLANVRGLI